MQRYLSRTVLLCAAVLPLGLSPVLAADAVSTNISSTSRGTTNQTTAESQTAIDQLQAQLWGLTVVEIQRARQLMQPGTPRAAFSAPTLSPVEVLGIHATTPAERLRYAELFAKAFAADTRRVFAWSAAYTEAARRLKMDGPVLDFGKKKPSVEENIYYR